MSTLRKTLLASLLLALGAHGCANDAAPDGDQSEDQLILRTGSLDQAGIVESATMMLAATPLDPQLDQYNQEDPFAIRGTGFAPSLAHRIAQFDGIDGTADWTDAQADAWAQRMSGANYLVVDTSKPCDFANPHTYLEIERAQMAGREHTTCGGRMPNEDALDVTLNWLVRGPAASVTDEAAMHDGVEQATQRSSNVFPYLAEMNGL
jgi:hypothetical protein